MKNLSKFMSLVLRHAPETIGITLDEGGWVNIHQLIYGIKKMPGFEEVMVWDIEKVVREDKKGRYALKDREQMIRASQGHSVKVDLGLGAQIPPSRLYHGTPTKYADAIKADGLKKMARHHVHLSPDIATAKQVAERRGKAVILFVDASKMYSDGYEFFVSENGVWLTDHVPVEYLEIM